MAREAADAEAQKLREQLRREKNRAGNSARQRPLLDLQNFDFQLADYLGHWQESTVGAGAGQIGVG